jgi:hypothetical protein
MIFFIRIDGYKQNLKSMNNSFLNDFTNIISSTGPHDLLSSAPTEKGRNFK